MHPARLSPPDNPSPYNCSHRCSLELPAFEWRVSALRLKGRRVDPCRKIRIDNRHVCRKPLPQTSPLEIEYLRRTITEQPYHSRERYHALVNKPVECQRDRRFQSDHTKRSEIKLE